MLQVSLTGSPAPTWKWAVAQWLDRPQQSVCSIPELSHWPAENIPGQQVRLRDGNYNSHRRESPAAISPPSQAQLAQMLHWTELPAPHPHPESVLELQICRWSRSLPPETRSHKFLRLPSRKSSFPNLMSTDSQHILQHIWELKLFVASGPWRRTSHSLSGALLHQLLPMGAVLLGQQPYRLLHCTC